MSIAERVQQTKKKMEESRDHTTSAHASPLPHSASFGSSETHGSQRLIVGKSSTMVSTAGSFPNNSAVHIPGLVSSASSAKQTPTSEIQNALLKPSFGKDSSSVAMSSVEAVNQRLDARINGPSYFTLARPAAAANYLMEKASTSGISTSAALSTPSQASNSQGNNHEVKVIQASHPIMKIHDSKGPIVPATHSNMAVGNQPSQGLTFVHVPSFISNHNEIARNVMGVVQQKVPDCPNSSLPSIEYITMPLHCQVCKIIITDVESLLVCDSCEKGTHLKCLQLHGTKTIPKADWHCPKCLSANNDKPFPPKYGRVTRSIPAVMTTSSGGGTMSVERNGEIPEAKFSFHKSMENENLNSPSAVQASNLDWKRPPGEELYSGTSINQSEEKDGLASATSLAQSGISDGQTAGIKLPDTDATKPASDSQFTSFDMPPEQSLPTSEMQRFLSESMSDIKGQSEYLCSNQKSETDIEIDLLDIKDANVPISAESTDDLIQKTSTTITDDVKYNSKSSEAFTNNVLEGSREGEHGSRIASAQIFGNGIDSGTTSLVEDLHKVDWVGDVLEVVENKTYYNSCCINGCIIKLQDNVIVSTNNQNLYPAKLVTLWEDNKVWSKLATVNEYCLPISLPTGIEEPSVPLKDEVYASDRISTILASSIHGLCVVLPEDKFNEETERRSLLADKDDVQHPVFMCKWIFDESKGIFQTPDKSL